MKFEHREVHLLPSDLSAQKASHIKLVKGVVLVNPHVRVLCPTLANNLKCRKTGKVLLRGETKEILRPEFLVKNHGDPDLQLWSCRGCEDKFLLRVKIQHKTNHNFEKRGAINERV